MAVFAMGATGVARDFACYLREQLARSGVRTQLALAERIEMDYGQLNKIFTGKTQRPEMETIRKLAAGLGRPVAEVAIAAGYDVPDGHTEEQAKEDELLGLLRQLERMRPDLAEQLARVRATATPPVYEAFRRNLARAWEANLLMALDQFRLGSEGEEGDGES